MASIAEIIAEQGRVLADSRRRQGERRGMLVTSLSQIPAQFMADRQAQQEAAAARAQQIAQGIRQQRTDARLDSAEKRAQATFETERDKARKEALAVEAQKVAAAGYRDVPQWIQDATRRGLFTPDESANLLQQAQQPEGAKRIVDFIAPLATPAAPPAPYTLNRGDQRRGPNNELLAENPLPAPEPPTPPNPTESSLAAAAAAGNPGAIKALEILRRQRASQAPSGPRTESGLTPTMEANVINRLTTQWGKAVSPVVDLNRAAKMMDVGLEAARRGDLAQGSQTLLVTFQKVLDPLSVVRESEYMRSAAGQSLMNRVKGAADRLTKGGAGVTLPELEKFAQLAKEAVQAQSTGYIDSQKERIGKTADRYKIPRELVFEEYDFLTPSVQSGGPKIGDIKTFPNGRKGKWDGEGWEPVP